MTKIYLIRHQHHGFITSYAFAKTPTQAQLDPLLEEAERVHSKKGWVRIIEVPLLDVGELPEVVVVGTPSTRTESIADKPKFTVSGTGVVTPPKN